MKNSNGFLAFVYKLHVSCVYKQNSSFSGFYLVRYCCAHCEQHIQFECECRHRNWVSNCDSCVDSWQCKATLSVRKALYKINALLLFIIMLYKGRHPHGINFFSFGSCSWFGSHAHLKRTELSSVGSRPACFPVDQLVSLFGLHQSRNECSQPKQKVLPQGNARRFESDGANSSSVEAATVSDYFSQWFQWASIGAIDFLLKGTGFRPKLGRNPVPCIMAAADIGAPNVRSCHNASSWHVSDLSVSCFGYKHGLNDEACKPFWAFGIYVYSCTGDILKVPVD